MVSTPKAARKAAQKELSPDRRSKGVDPIPFVVCRTIHERESGWHADSDSTPHEESGTTPLRLLVVLGAVLLLSRCGCVCVSAGKCASPFVFLSNPLSLSGIGRGGVWKKKKVDARAAGAYPSVSHKFELSTRACTQDAHERTHLFFSRRDETTRYRFASMECSATAGSPLEVGHVRHFLFFIRGDSSEFLRKVFAEKMQQRCEDGWTKSARKVHQIPCIPCGVKLRCGRPCPDTPSLLQLVVREEPGHTKTRCMMKNNAYFFTMNNAYKYKK